MTKLMELFMDEQGATALEYGLIAALIAAAIGASALALGEQVVATFEYTTNQMLSATSAATQIIGQRALKPLNGSSHSSRTGASGMVPPAPVQSPRESG